MPVEIVKHNTLFYGSLLLLECLFWGIGNPIIKIVLESITPFYGLTIRFALAFLIFMVISGKRFVSRMRREYLFPGIIVSFFTALAFATSNLALMRTSSTVTGFLMALAVIFTPFLARFFLGTRVNPVLCLPITLVVLGMYYLCGASGIFEFGAGEAYAVFSSVACACMLVASGKYMMGDIDPFVISVLQTGMICLYCLPFALYLEEVPIFSAVPLTGWLGIIYLAATCSCAAYIIQNLALSRVPSTYVALLFCSEPIFTAIASYFLLGETLNGRGVFGAALITVSITIASIIPVEYDSRSSLARIGRIRTKKAIRDIKKRSAGLL